MICAPQSRRGAGRSRPPTPRTCETPTPAASSRHDTCCAPVPLAATSPTGPGRTTLAKPSATPETIAVPQIGEEDEGHVSHVPKSLLVSIIAPRIEETFEMVRNRLEASGFDKIAGRRVVLTGGEVRPGDAIRIELPPEPHRPLSRV